MSYSPDLTQAVRRALYRLRWRLGKAWADRVVLVGGLVPPFLVPDPGPGIDPHIGTSDIDLAIGVFAPEEEAYVTLVRGIRDCGFTQRKGESSFRWFGNQDGIKIVLEILCPQDDEAERRIRRHVEADGGSGLTAFQVRGIELAASDCIEVMLDEDVAEMGSRGPIGLLVVGPTTLIALKAQALADAHKPKHAYDIVWLCDAWPHDDDESNGAAALAKTVLSSSIHEEEFIRESLATLRTLFSTPDSPGPVSYAQTIGREGDEYEQARMYAHGLVNEFLSAVGSTDES